MGFQLFQGNYIDRLLASVTTVALLSSLTSCASQQSQPVTLAFLSKLPLPLFLIQ